MKNILITFPNAIDPTTGGLEKVYHNLTPFLRNNGYNVYAVYRVKSDYDTHSVYTDIFYSDDYRCGIKYNEIIDQVIQNQDINIVICAFQYFRLVRYLSTLSDIKLYIIYIIYHRLICLVEYIIFQADYRILY